MSHLLPFIIAGLVAGSLYGLSAMGLVLTYKTSGIFNFGHGALASVAAYVFYSLSIEYGLDWRIGAFIAVCVVGPLMGLAMEVLARTLTPQRTAWKVVGTTGLILLVQGGGSLWYGPDTIFVDNYLPGSDKFLSVAGVNIQYSQILTFVVCVIIALAFSAMFRYTQFGTAMRAVVQSPELVELDGMSSQRIRRIAWSIGSTTAALTGVLILPVIGLNPLLLTLLIVQAFAAASLGLFKSIPLTFFGGLAIGIGESLLTRLEIALPSLTGLSRALPFIVLIVVMLVTPSAKLLPPTMHEKRPSVAWHGPPVLRVMAYIVVFGFLASAPLWTAPEILAPYWIGALAVVIIMLALGLLIRTAGIVSLCAASFAGIGAAALSHLTVGAHVPWLLAVLVAGLIAVPVGALLALPAIRLRGLFLALATLGFGLLVERLFYKQSFMFTTLTEGIAVPRPEWASSDTSYYYVVLAIVVMAVMGTGVIHRGRLGRLLLGMSESPRAVATLGLNTRVTSLLVICLASFMMAIGGALYAGGLERVQASSTLFMSFNSLLFVAVLALQPFRAPWYAIAAGATQVVPGYFPGSATTYILTVVFGVSAIVVSLNGGSPPMPKPVRDFLDQRFGNVRFTSDLSLSDRWRKSAKTVAVPRAASSEKSGLKIENIAVRFGGLVALDGVSLEAPMGRVTGLLGPNGAGKTTLFNVCSGLNQPSTGTIALNGKSLSGQSPGSRARSGLGRTFQIMELCESLTVLDNVRLGMETGQAGANPFRQVVASPAELARRDQSAAEALELCGIADLADKQAGALSTGQRRLVELARCLAGRFDVLLLDEPSSGLDSGETRAFGDLLRHVVRERGCGILLVEHDMSLVLDVCDFVYVLELGRPIFSGTASQARKDTEVQRAYLGDRGSEVEKTTEMATAGAAKTNSTELTSADTFSGREN